MDEDIVIKVENVSKKFTRSIKRSMLYGTVDMLKSMVGIKPDTSMLRKGEFWSLNNINFEVKKGEMFALVGANGSGKSTLLRLISGIFPPDTGRITTKGRIGALISVGAGFHPHMTGRENIYLNGIILGMSKSDINTKFQDIISFADIGDFIDAPVSTYSSGMTVRLGFAIAIHSNPDIVLVDEILAVGDSKFQRKCLKKIQQKREEGVTFLLVTHNMQQVETMCNRALFIKDGKQLKIGDPRDVIGEYEMDLMYEGEDADYTSYKESYNRKLVEALPLVDKTRGYGTDEIEVLSVKTFNKDKKYSTKFVTGETLSLNINIKATEDYKNTYCLIRFAYMHDIKNNDIQSVIGVKEKIYIKKGESKISMNLDNAGFTTGKYRISIHLFDESSLTPYFQGSFGYIDFVNKVATLLRVGDQGQPYYWPKYEFEITST